MNDAMVKALEPLTEALQPVREAVEAVTAAVLLFPNDADLTALALAVEKFPAEDVPLKAYIDRLEELGCGSTFAAYCARIQLAQREMARQLNGAPVVCRVRASG